MNVRIAILMGLCLAPARAGEVESAVERLRGVVGDSPDLVLIESAYADVTHRLAAAEMDAARARTRMASHTGAILSRELKKVHTSARLVEMTRKTGRSEEVARYQRRHEMLLAAIDQIAVDYQSMIDDLCAMNREHVERGFADCAERLVALEVADQIQVNNLVKAHYEHRCRDPGASLEQWRQELEKL